MDLCTNLLSTSGEWNTWLKHVKTEQLTLTGFTLVGSVGGWFGLMVGFSFYGIGYEVVEVINQRPRWWHYEGG